MCVEEFNFSLVFKVILKKFPYNLISHCLYYFLGLNKYGNIKRIYKIWDYHLINLFKTLNFSKR